ncbi:hypothetical protein Slin15195_G091380 [Septoria linicola]|uniref:Uncharacterized protein n=1 Tax=Septoria linicola TaxID=215465 RepID=A0A9Q9AUU3_9PEZI|nr:hypothetical protein Slin14017_G054530 [Septoria linicola]USW55819.1 hypothetical protein Slin15195_G091380 [Septoria linicola]
MAIARRATAALVVLLGTIALGMALGDPCGDGPPSHTILDDDDALFRDDGQLVSSGDDWPACDWAPMTCERSLCSDNADFCETSTDSQDELSAHDKASRSVQVHYLNPDQRMVLRVPIAPSADTASEAGGRQMYQGAFIYAVQNDCSDWEIINLELENAGKGKKLVVEHILELQTIPRFLETLDTGNLPGGAGMQTGRLSRADVMNNWNFDTLPANVPVIGGVRHQTPNRRVMEAIGSGKSLKNLVVADEDLNGAKAKLWASDNPRDLDEFRKDVRDWLDCKISDPAVFIQYIRAARAVFAYL